MDRLRYSVILIIVVAFAVGIWTRYLAIFSVETATPVGGRSRSQFGGLSLAVRQDKGPRRSTFRSIVYNSNPLGGQ
jgi:hypothetical protein